ncbi:putative transposase [Mycena kentingensis (nom. inval.)]|nr:putative transposase [Mycena kentingensis (nom. inval.)]
MWPLILTLLDDRTVHTIPYTSQRATTKAFALNLFVHHLVFPGPVATRACTRTTRLSPESFVQVMDDIEPDYAWAALPNSPVATISTPYKVAAAYLSNTLMRLRSVTSSRCVRERTLSVVMPPKKKKASADPGTDANADVPGKKPPQCCYSAQDLVTMMEVVVRHKDQLGDPAGLKGFLASLIAAELNPPCKGAPKTASSVQAQFRKQKANWTAVVGIENNSGFAPWDKERGANITPEKAAVWDAYVAKNKSAKPFRNCGFPLYDYFEEILPKSVLAFRGKGVFRPMTGAQEGDDSEDDEDNADKDIASSASDCNEPPRHQSPAWDIESGSDDDTTEPVSAPLASAAPATPAPVQLRKRGASETPLPSSRPQKARIAGPKHTASQTPANRRSAADRAEERFNAINGHLQETTTVLRELLAPPAPSAPTPTELLATPARLSAAVRRVRKFESVWLPDYLCMQFTDMLEQHRELVASYIANWDDENVSYGRQWILRKLGVLDRLPYGYDLSENTLIVLLPSQNFEY